MIKNQGMEFINGKAVGFIKVISFKIIDMVLASFMMERIYYTRGIGNVVNKLPRSQDKICNKVTVAVQKHHLKIFVDLLLDRIRIKMIILSLQKINC